jgi:hypothetical protein
MIVASIDDLIAGLPGDPELGGAEAGHLFAREQAGHKAEPLGSTDASPARQRRWPSA